MKLVSTRMDTSDVNVGPSTSQGIKIFNYWRKGETTPPDKVQLINDHHIDVIPPPLTISWHNITVSTKMSRQIPFPFRKGNDKPPVHILNHVNGQAKSGELLAIMGSSTGNMPLITLWYLTSQMKVSPRMDTSDVNVGPSTSQGIKIFNYWRKAETTPPEKEDDQICNGGL
ncbi:unnamed protein product [Medioppia subpectinata]|uniref:Uncharacterized protein n=1 Tax=Medioppia subpectinata TaxID=1979941 RepID=A0A7R9PUB7_9ACAR|nr:unnamed protein product [Medioppia subpectinata]CAG2101408.1 unnamed protein product [Medioppia subpectinata]